MLGIAADADTLSRIPIATCSAANGTTAFQEKLPTLRGI